MFEKPELVDWVVEGFLLDKEIEEIATEIKGYGV